MLVCLNALCERRVQRGTTGRDCLKGRKGKPDGAEGEQARAVRAVAQLYHHGGTGERRGQDTLELELLRRGGGVMQRVQRVVLLRLLQLCAWRVDVTQGRRAERGSAPYEIAARMCSWELVPTAGSATLTGMPIFDSTAGSPMPESSRI